MRKRLSDVVQLSGHAFLFRRWGGATEAKFAQGALSAEAAGEL